MKQLYFIVFLVLVSLCKGQSNPEDEIPIFNLDDYYVEPKMTLSVGTRVLNGSKTSFGGQGIVESTQNIGAVGDTGIVRNYHDGSIFKDARTDSDGNPIDVGDGKTSSWTMTDLNQIVNDGADIAFHSYSAQVTDSSIHQKDAGMSLGTEIVVARDMGKFGKHFAWKLFAGVGINGIQNSMRDTVPATITTVTDTYTLGGQTAPTAAPYTAPSSTTDADGNVIDTTILIGQKPDSRTIATSTGTVDNYWKVKGTFLTVRLGPTLIYNVSDAFRVSVSAGPVLVYSGTDYSVEQILKPATSDDITTTVSDTTGKTLTGYYADASIEYLINDRAGLYMGAFYQSSGDYQQTITDSGASYTADIDLSKLQGLRAGLNFKF